MGIFIATAPIDPASNELRGIKRDTQEDAEAIAAANSRANQPWVVFELTECARTIVDPPRLVRTKEPTPRSPILAGEKTDADPTQR